MREAFTRRAFLGALTALAAPGAGCAAAPSAVVGSAPGSPPPAPVIASHREALARLERRVGGRVGVFALEPASGATLAHRADERFALCSTFKWALAAAVLGEVDRGGLELEQSIAFGESDLEEYAPVARARLPEGRMTVEALARAAVTRSDNTATNLLLTRIGGPEGMTRFFRELGDEVTRLDRNEPMLNTNEPGDPRDTTTPRAMVGALRRVVTGSVLGAASRERLLAWLIATETGRSRLRAGLPADWRVGDKTGTGNRGACNDVAICWTPAGATWFIAAYLSDSRASLAALEAAHAEIGRLVAAT